MRFMETDINALNDNLVYCSLIVPLFMSFAFYLLVSRSSRNRHILCHIIRTILWYLIWCCLLISVGCNMVDSYDECLAQVLMCVTIV
jgi:hypothetical protein